MECPRCGQSQSNEARYCNHCGKALFEEPIEMPLLRQPNSNSNQALGIALGFGVVLILAFVIVFNINDFSSSIVEDEHITFVKNGSPSSYPDITYDKAFSDFFSNRSWEYFESEGHKDVVEFHGNCMYQNVEVTATIQFVLNMDDGTFEISYLAFNDVPQSILVEYALITKIFESY